MLGDTSDLTDCLIEGFLVVRSGLTKATYLANELEGGCLYFLARRWRCPLAEDFDGTTHDQNLPHRETCGITSRECTNRLAPAPLTRVPS